MAVQRFDTVDYSASSLAVDIDLLDNTVAGGDAEGDTLISIESIIGSNDAGQRDYIYGDAADNAFYGMAGDDFLQGGMARIFLMAAMVEIMRVIRIQLHLLILIWRQMLIQGVRLKVIFFTILSQYRGLFTMMLFVEQW